MGGTTEGLTRKETSAGAWALAKLVHWANDSASWTTVSQAKNR